MSRQSSQRRSGTSPQANAELCIGTDVQTTEANESRLHGLFKNLFQNAIEHGGYDVTLRVGRLSDADGLYVEDNGPRIPEPIRDDIFEYGYSTSDDGTGYGLSIVKQIVDGHRWNIAIGEGDAGGPRFEITGIGFL